LERHEDDEAGKKQNNNGEERRKNVGSGKHKLKSFSLPRSPFLFHAVRRGENFEPKKDEG
jgi:hypothetical protein